VNAPVFNALPQLEPTKLWSHFQQLCDHPRPSKKEQAVVDYVLNFAQQHNLAVKQDGVGNVIISKPATEGLGHLRGVVLQSHLDMVPQKNLDSDHDFETDTIKAYIDGDWVTAQGTTLGADNGIGVAAILAVLEATDIPHGPIEALLTIDEEAGMTGANGLQAGWLNGDILLNLDSEDEGELFVGCAGGEDVNITLPYTAESVSANTVAFELAITGLKGGHSGCDIHLGRGNANKITNRLLSEALKQFTLGVNEFNGGTLRNAIPREAFTVITVAESEASSFKAFVVRFENALKAEIAGSESNLSIQLSLVDVPATQIPSELLARFIKAVYACPNGVARMIDALPDVTETSSNLAIIFNDDKNIYVQCLVRSSIDSARQERCDAIASVFELVGANAVQANDYPGWEPDMESPLLTMMIAKHEQVLGYKPEVKVIHAGLECGILGATYPNWDMISFGPTIRGAHSPDEKVHIPAVASFWKYLQATLADIPQK
jgi:dipeptidase D